MEIGNYSERCSQGWEGEGGGSAKTGVEGGSLVNSWEWGEFYLDQEGKFQMCGGKVLYMI